MMGLGCLDGLSDTQQTCQSVGQKDANPCLDLYIDKVYSIITKMVKMAAKKVRKLTKTRLKVLEAKIIR